MMIGTDFTGSCKTNCNMITSTTAPNTIRKCCKLVSTALWSFIYWTLYKVCQWLATGRWFSPASSTNKTDRHDIAEILLKVALNAINLKLNEIKWKTNKIAIKLTSRQLLHKKQSLTVSKNIPSRHISTYLHFYWSVCIKPGMWADMFLCLGGIEFYLILRFAFSSILERWFYNYLWNQCLSSLKLWVRTPFMARFNRYNSMW
jgi:hypothetical protein